MDDPFTFFDELVRVETRLYHHLDGVLRSEHQLVTSQFEFLRYIDGHDRARVADLAAKFAIGVGATSKAIDRLERLGLVTRLPNPDDRRSSILALSPEGATRLAAAMHTVSGALRALTRVLTPDQREATTEALQSLRSHLEEENVGTPAG